MKYYWSFCGDLFNVAIATIPAAFICVFHLVILVVPNPKNRYENERAGKQIEKAFI